jgi:hypothetical protein
MEPGLQFKALVKDAAGGTVLRPILRSWFYEAKYPPKFSVEFNNYAMNDRKPDGWFHPSTHPLWPARMLWWYLTQPDKLLVEHIEYMGNLSITVGHALHGFVQMVLTEAGILKGTEVAFSDEETMARGSLDGIVDLELPGYAGREHVFEFKTTNAAKLSSLQDLDIEGFRKKWPAYYAQQQEYMRISGMRVSVVLMLALGYPWEMREFHIPYNPLFANGVADKYKLVLAHVRGDVMPEACCSIGSKAADACPARAVCPVASP